MHIGKRINFPSTLVFKSPIFEAVTFLIALPFFAQHKLL